MSISHQLWRLAYSKSFINFNDSYLGLLLLSGVHLGKIAGAKLWPQSGGIALAIS